MNKMKLIYILTNYFTNMDFNIIIPSINGSSKLSLPFKFLDEDFVCIFHSSHSCYIICQSSPLFFHPLIFHEQHKSQSPSLYSFLKPTVMSCLFCSTPLLSTLLSEIPSVCLLLGWQTESYPQKITGKIISFSLCNLQIKTNKFQKQYPSSK